MKQSDKQNKSPEIYTQIQNWGDRDVILLFCSSGSVQIHLFHTPVEKCGFNIYSIIGSLWVNTEQRSNGVGMFLMKCAEQWLKENEYNEVYLEWDKIDSPEWVVDWYSKNRWKIVSEQDNYKLMKKLLK